MARSLVLAMVVLATAGIAGLALSPRDAVIGSTEASVQAAVGRSGSVVVTGTGAGDSERAAYVAALADGVRNGVEALRRIAAERLENDTVVKSATSVSFGCGLAVQSETVSREAALVRDSVELRVTGVSGTPFAISVQMGTLADAQRADEAAQVLEKALGRCGVRLVSKGWQKPLFEVKLEIPRNMESPRPAEFSRKTTPAPSSGYDGLLVEVQGQLEPAIGPKIVTSTGEVVYGAGDPEVDTVAARGVAQYTQSKLKASDLLRKMGAGKILVVNGKARKDVGVDVEVSDADAEKIRRANAATGFLKQARVVFVVSRVSSNARPNPR